MNGFSELESAIARDLGPKLFAVWDAEYQNHLDSLPADPIGIFKDIDIPPKRWLDGWAIPSASRVRAQMTGRQP